MVLTTELTTSTLIYILSSIRCTAPACEMSKSTQKLGLDRGFIDLNKPTVHLTYLEELVESAEAPGRDYERLAVVEHPELSGEEVVELEG